MSKLNVITTALYNKEEIPVNANHDIRNLMLELIGEDEDEQNPPIGKNSPAVAVQNELRAELRDKVKAL